ncbi:hypothetical protein N7450_011379 [Penicillium hetheringtonii]|uniref:histidine kinase n=1 Tax=Penicillium hetheringtonii TaxID=911720 RepID=A0AAD6GLS2_9EURO|nr:hypothetical protein N7450_011379 [Penicillium hetheringtonii]
MPPREVRYYCTFEQDPLSTSSPRLSPDHTLTALTQLGVYRFGCNRSFVSIIDGEQQHLIAEATASVSLRNADSHLPNDGIFLGVRTLDLEWGVCPHAIRLFTGQDASKITDTENITANRTRNIIRDFTLEDFYKDRPYVQNWPHFRFYAEVPLYSPSGYVLGSYCVVDNKARADFGDEEVAALQEIADAISQHLENIRIVHYNRRGENLVKGLTDFVKGHAKPDRVDTSKRLPESREKLNFHNLNPWKNNVHASELDASLSTSKSSIGESTLDQSTSVTQEDGALSLFSNAKDSGTTQATSQPSSLAPGSPESTELLAYDDYFPNTTIDDVPIAERLAAIFSRAAILLKSSMDLDGVVFLDASQSDSQFDLSETSANQSISSNPKHLDSQNDPWDCLEGSRSSEHPPSSLENLCCPLNYCTGIPPFDNPSPEQRLSIPEGLLQILIKNFPNGHVFDMTNKDGTNTLQDKVTSLLSHNLPDAKSVLFAPIWDWNKARWLAGTLVWTNDYRRPLGIEELHYFKVFGDSIISEVSRVHWSATEKSKFDFVSSISHELRSPLHGILGSTELAQSLPLEPAQQDIIKMIEQSGLTLLDTIDQLLEYCKINDLATNGSSDARGQVDLKNQSEFDLGILVEEVTTVLCAGRKSQRSTNIPIVASGSSEEACNSDEVSVIVRIQQLNAWKVQSTAGAWRRILMNIIGNAMKWTKNGFVEVILTEAKLEKENRQGSSFAHVSVRDTGCGISRPFLKDMLFSPFAQEDSLSPGIGLGLSIARKLATSLGGNIGVKSEIGAGTQVDIFIPVTAAQSVEIADRSSLITKDFAPSTSINASILGLQLHPEVDEVPTGILGVDAKRKLSIRHALMDVFATRLGWQLSPRKPSDRMHGDVAIVEEADFSHMLSEGLLQTDPKHVRDFFIILGDRKMLPADVLPANIIRVSPPFGPRTLYDAAERFLRSYRALMHLDLTEVTPITMLSSNQSQISTSAARQTVSSSTYSSPLNNLQLQSFATQPECPQDNTSVLIVDDNDINLKIMSTFIHKIGFHYVTATNGLIALEKYSNSDQRYAFVLMGKPKGSSSRIHLCGLANDSARYIHARNGRIGCYEEDTRSNALKPSCIMAVTAVASNETRKAALKAGVNDFLVKPLSLTKLRELMLV